VTLITRVNSPIIVIEMPVTEVEERYIPLSLSQQDSAPSLEGRQIEVVIQQSKMDNPAEFSRLIADANIGKTNAIFQLFEMPEKKEEILAQVTQPVIRSFLSLSYKLILSEVHQKIQNGKKLSLKELGLVNQWMDGLSEITQKLAKNNFKSSSENLQKFSQIAAWAIDRLERIQKEASVEGGTLFFTNSARHAALHNHSRVGLSTGIATLATGSTYEHAGVMTGFNRTEQEISEVYGIQQNRSATISDYVGNDFRALDWKQLITPAAQEKLEGTFGDTWEDQVKINYEYKIGSLKADSSFSGMVNSSNRRNQSVLFPHQTFYPNKPVESMKGDRTIFCSEFAAEFTFNALNMLNSELQSQLGMQEDVVINPLVYERFSAASPGRLERLMHDYTKPVPMPKVLEEVVDLESVAAPSIAQPLLATASLALAMVSSLTVAYLIYT